MGSRSLGTAADRERLLPPGGGASTEPCLKPAHTEVTTVSPRTGSEPAPGGILLVLDPDRRVGFTPAHDPARLGLETRRADDPNEAAVLLATEHVAAILVALPEAETARLLRLLRTIPAAEGIPILAAPPEPAPPEQLLARIAAAALCCASC